MKKLNIARFTAGMLIAATLLSPLTAWASVNQTQAVEKKSGIAVYVDGVPISFGQPPINENGKVLVPMRAIFEALGATVEWMPDEQRVKAVKETPTGTLLCTVTIPDSLMFVHYTDKQIADNHQLRWFYSDLEPAPKIVNGTTFVPTRAIAEAFGATVTWDGTAQTVHISMKDAKIVNPNTGETLSVSAPTSTPAPIQPPTEPQRKDEPFNLKVGDIAGNIVKDPNDYDSDYASTFTDAYRQGSIGQCTWYAESRFYEVHGIRMPFGIGSAKEWLDNATSSDQLIIITDLNNIRDKTVAVYQPIKDQSHPGHVVFIEHVERDEAGNPTWIYYTEANGPDTLNKGKYDHGYDGIVKKKSFDKFKGSTNSELIGYIAVK